MKTFNELFNEHTGEGIKKWSNYGDIYDKHFAPYRDQQYKHIRDWCIKWWVNENMGKIFSKGIYQYFYQYRHK